MFRKLTNSKYFPFVLFAFAFIIYTANNQGVSIYILDEAKNASCAREMLEMGNWDIPTFNYNLRTDKPPLHYFFMMLSYSIFGVNSWAARFFSGIFGALTVLITFLYTKRFTDQKTARWTSFSLLSSIHLAIQFHLAVPDPYLIFFFTWSLFLFFAVLKDHKWREIILLYASIGLGTLAKGPIAIALPGLIFLLFLIFSKQLRWNTILKLKPFQGIGIVLLIALPWYIASGIATDWEWTRGFFLKHNIGRFTNEMEGHGGIFLITFAYILIGMFPFSAFFIQSFRNAFKNKSNQFILFALIASLSVILFFSFSGTKLPNYTVPSYPFLAIIIGYYFSSIQFKARSLNRSIIAITVLFFILIPGLYIGLKFDPSLKNVNYIAFFFTPMILTAGCALYFLHRKKMKESIITIGISGMLGGVIFFVFAFPVIDAQNPVSKSLSYFDHNEVAYFQKFNPSYSFYLRKEIKELTEDEIIPFFAKNPDGVIITTKRKIEKLELPNNIEVFFSSKDVFERPTTQLLRLQKNTKGK